MHGGGGGEVLVEMLTGVAVSADVVLVPAGGLRHPFVPVVRFGGGSCCGGGGGGVADLDGSADATTKAAAELLGQIAAAASAAPETGASGGDADLAGMEVFQIARGTGVSL